MSASIEHIAGPDVSRAAVLDSLRAALDASGLLWAWQGPQGAVDTWLGDSGPSDLDVWIADESASLDADLDALPAARVADSRDVRRLRHTSRAVETAQGLAVLDVTMGDLRVGPVLLLPAGQVTVVDGQHGPRLAGVAAVADLLVRPVLRGRLPKTDRLAEARSCWETTTAEERSAFVASLRNELGDRVTAGIVSALDTGTAPEWLPGAARKVLLRRTVSPAGLGAAWKQRRSVIPAGRSAGPLGLRTSGVVVVLVGTDGSGKSTVGRQLGERLSELGFDVDEAYFGMARGNLPGVGLARKLLGVASAGDTAEPVVIVEEPDVEFDSEPDLSHASIRKAAAWFYAVEYGWRYARMVAPKRRKRRVVICDRYVYDLRESPWPGSPAARFAQKIVPAPDVLVLPDAPDELIHARKPERAAADQARQQQAFRDLLLERPAKVTELVVDTSGASPDSVRELVSVVVAAAHTPRRL